MRERANVAVVGGGQAGLATSFELTARGIEHVVLERGRIGRSWRERWDSFCLVTPNWSVQLPGGRYEGPDPDGYMPGVEVADHLERYARSFDAPAREGVAVDRLARSEDGFLLQTSDGDLHARSVVVASGAYQRPHRPAGAATIPPDIPQLDAEDYRNPDTLPDGRILIVGSGQTGCQIAEELHEAGREVFLACGRAPWITRRIGERDCVRWIVDSGFMDQPVGALPDPSARLSANILATGRDGGHDLHLRTLHAMGVTLLGHFLGVEGSLARFAPDLADSIAWGDARTAELMGLIAKTIADRGLPSIELPSFPPFDGSSPEDVDLAGFGAVLFAGGFRPDYGRWIDIAGAFDPSGFPLQIDGASTVAAGLYFVGVHFLRKRKSSLLMGVGEDAAIVAAAIGNHG